MHLDHRMDDGAGHVGGTLAHAFGVGLGKFAGYRVNRCLRHAVFDIFLAGKYRLAALDLVADVGGQAIVGGRHAGEIGVAECLAIFLRHFEGIQH